MFGKQKQDSVRVVEVEKKRLNWTAKKVVVSVVLFIISIICIIVGIEPLINGDYEIKSFANLLFVAFHGFYMFSFSAVTRSSQFFFWALSFFMLDAMTLIFIFYDDIFF